MKLVVGLVLVAITLGLSNEIAKINHLKSEAHKAYLEGNYQAAIEHYGLLIDSFLVSEEEILMNYANAAFLMIKKKGSPTQSIDGPVNSSSAPTEEQSDSYGQLAQNIYTGLAQNASVNMRSVAFNQLGVISFNSAPPPKPGKDILIQAQGLFKSALKTDQHNQPARFNYELVTKLLEQEDQNQQEQDKEQEQDQEKDEQQDQEQNQEQQNQEQQQKEQEEQEQSGEDQQQEKSGEEENSDKQEGDPKESDQEKSKEEPGEENPKEEPLNASPEKMEELNISEEKARMILEAMKNSEVQYIQQNQRKATKRPDSGKPDW